jgi:hypothetical protein
MCGRRLISKSFFDVMPILLQCMSPLLALFSRAGRPVFESVN